MNDAADRHRGGGRDRDGRHDPHADDPSPGHVHPIDEALATIDAMARLRQLRREGKAHKTIAKQLNHEWVPGPGGVLWTAALVRRRIDEAAHGDGRSEPPTMPAALSLPSWPPPSGLRRPSFVPADDPRRSQAVAQASTGVGTGAAPAAKPMAMPAIRAKAGTAKGVPLIALPATRPSTGRRPSSPRTRLHTTDVRTPQWLAATGAAVVLLLLAGFVSIRSGAPVGADRSPRPDVATADEAAPAPEISTTSPAEDPALVAPTVAAPPVVVAPPVVANPIEMDEGRLVLVSDGGDRWGMLVTGGALRVVAPGEDYWDCVVQWARPVDSVSLAQLEAAEVAIDWVETVDRCPARVLMPTDDPVAELTHYEGSIVSLPETPWGQVSYWVRNGELHEIPHAPDYWDCVIRAEGRITVVTEEAVARLGWPVTLGRADQCPDAAW